MLSVPPEVKKTLPAPQPSAWARAARLSSRRRRAAIPRAWREPGFPYSSMAARAASRAWGMGRVVAALSR